MNYWKVILATVVIFGAGVVTGGLLVNFVNHSHPHAAAQPHRPPPTNNPPPRLQVTNSPAPHLADLLKPRTPDILNENFLKQLDGVLDLSPDQFDAIKRIIADGQDQNRSIWTNSTAQMRKVMQDTRHAIREQLTPPQQKQFEDLLKQFRAPRKAANANGANGAGSTNAPPANDLPPAKSEPPVTPAATNNPAV